MTVTRSVEATATLSRGRVVRRRHGAADLDVVAGAVELEPGDAAQIRPSRSVVVDAAGHPAASATSDVASRASTSLPPLELGLATARSRPGRRSSPAAARARLGARRRRSSATDREPSDGTQRRRRPRGTRRRPRRGASDQIGHGAGGFPVGAARPRRRYSARSARQPSPSAARTSSRAVSVAAGTMERMTVRTRSVRPGHAGVVRRVVRRPHPGPGGRVARRRRRRARPRRRPHRLGQDAGGLPVGDRPADARAPPTSRRHPRALHLAAQGARGRRRAQPALTARRHHPGGGPPRRRLPRRHGRRPVRRHVAARPPRAASRVRPTSSSRPPSRCS